MPIAIRNNTRTMLTFNLTHDCVGGEYKSRVEKVTRAAVDRHGRGASRVHRLTHPPVLTIAAGETTSDVPRAATQVPAVKRAIKAGKLTVVDDKPDAKAAIEKPTTPTKPARASVRDAAPKTDA